MRNLTLLSGLLLLTSTFSAHAVHMGQISANSALGENLDARISLYGLGELSPATLAVEIRPDITEASGSAARRAVAAIVPSIVSTPSGYTYIQLDSSAAISEPVVQFRLRLGSPSVTMIKHYVLTLDPRAPPPTATRTPATTVPVQTATMTYGPVRGGQTLFGILQERGLNTSNANVARVVAANPHAFVESNPDRLRVGVLLDLPGAAATASKAPIAGAMAAAPVPVPLVHADVETPIEPQPRAVADFGTSAWRESDRAVAERIQSLEEKFAAIRARYAEQGRVSATAPDATAEPAPATPAATVDSAAPAAVSAPVKPTAVAVENPSPATPARAQTLATPPPVRQSSSSGAQGLSWAALTMLVGGAIAILALLGYASRLLAVRG